MTPDRIDIQKPLYEQGKAFSWGRPEATDPSPSDDGAPLDEPPRALAGFWLRATAFLIDGVALYMVARFWVEAGREFFLDHPQWLIPLATAIYFTYFGLLNGPLGKGQTAGKWLLGLTVRDGVGQAPSGKVAWVRTAIQCGPLLSLWLTDRLLHAFPHPGAEQHDALFFASVLVGIPAFTALIFSAASVAFRPDKRAAHDLLTGAFVCRKGEATAALDTLSALSAHRARNSLLPVLVMTFVFFGFMQYQTIATRARSRDYLVFLGELWEEHGLEGFQPQTPRLGMLANFALVDGPEDVTAATAVQDVQAPSTDTVLRLAYPVIYYRQGRVDDATVMATIDEDGLTTAVADWVQERRDHPAIAGPLKELRSRLNEAGAQMSCDAVLIQFYEVLSMPWYLGPRYSRLAGHATHQRVIMPLETPPAPVSHPHSAPYREQ